MKTHKKIFYIVISLAFLSEPCASQFLNMNGIRSTLGSYFGYTYFGETCSEYSIPINVTQLQVDIDEHIFGQPLARKIIKILHGYKNSPADDGKALVLSFHGWPGTGKNYMVNFILKAIYKRGLESSFKKMYIGRSDFPDPLRIHEYQEKLQNDMKQIVQNCPKAVFIFDEVNDIPENVLDILAPYMNHYEKVNGVDYRQSIFILLSNANGNDIVEQMLHLNKKRSDLKLSDFDEILRKKSFSSGGGLKKSAFITSHLIDHFIPFLPLEQRHVELCVKAEFKKRGLNFPSQRDIDKVMSIMTYGPPDNRIYANAGCKRIKKQVDYVLAGHRKKKEL